MLALLDQDELVDVSDEEALIAREASARLKPFAEQKVDIKVRVVESCDIVVPLPARAVEHIVNFLEAMAAKKPFSVIPHESELTTQQAADFLNVSRPYVVGLLDKGAIPHRLVGAHRRLRMADLLEYKKKTEEQRRVAIARMVAESRKLDPP
jgi:excisionase family DNA binding protein